MQLLNRHTMRSYGSAMAGSRSNSSLYSISSHNLYIQTSNEDTATHWLLLQQISIAVTMLNISV